MKTLEQSVPARYLAQLVDHLESIGTPCRDALSAAQVRSLNDPEARLTTGQVEALLAEIVRLTGRNDLGFELGKLIKLNSHDMLGYAIMSCPTVDHCLRLVARYFRLITPMFAMRYVRNERDAEMIIQPVVAMQEHTMNFYLEAIAVSNVAQLGSFGQVKMRRCDNYLSIPAPAHIERYRKELHPARFFFGQDQLPGLRIVVSSDILDRPLAMRDMRAMHLAEARCKQLLQEVSEAGRWSDWVAMMLREAEDCQPTLDELARILNISSRTLDRYLEKESVSFRDLALRIRNERACELLASGRYAVSQIAYRLGYTDIANFSRTFKRINGISPSAYRERPELAGASGASPFFP